MAPRSRRKANAYAQTVVDRGGGITDAHVLEALRRWRFAKNKIRKNVMSASQQWVFSDTLGLSRSRNGKIVCTRATREHPEFMKLLCSFVTDTSGVGYAKFPFTSISVNYDYGAKLHRDKNNAGPSLTRSLGSFRGGFLAYHPNDTGEKKLQAIKKEKAQLLDTNSNFVLFVSGLVYASCS